MCCTSSLTASFQSSAQHARSLDRFMQHHSGTARALLDRRSSSPPRLPPDSESTIGGATSRTRVVPRAAGIALVRNI
jgi:hypothetical protein